MKTTDLVAPRCRMETELGWHDPRFRASAFCDEGTKGPTVMYHAKKNDRWLCVEAEMPRSADEPVRGSLIFYLSPEHATQLAKDILAALPSEQTPATDYERIPSVTAATSAALLATAPLTKHAVETVSAANA